MKKSKAKAKPSTKKRASKKPATTKEPAAEKRAAKKKSAAAEKKQNRDTRRLLMEIAADHDVFPTPGGIPVVRLEFQGYALSFLLPDKQYEGILAAECVSHHSVVPKTAEIRDAMRLIETRAITQPKRPVFVRIGHYKGKVYADLGDESLRAVEIDAEGWRIIDDPPIHFLRPDGMGGFPEPQRGGKIELLRQYINVTKRDWPTYVSYVLGSWNPWGQHPVGVGQGRPGCGKTTVARYTKSVIDPYRTELDDQEEVYAGPGTVDDLMVFAVNSWLLGFDNLSKLRESLSDALCRLATGGAMVKRKLYSNQQVARLKAQRPVFITTVSDLVKKDDLRSRCLFFPLPRLADRKSEWDLNQGFLQDWPLILGAILDCVSCALRNRSTTQPMVGHRLPDFTVWVKAAEPATGFAPGTIEKALADNRKAAADEALQTPLAGALRRMAAEAEERKEPYRLKPEALLATLDKAGVVDLPPSPTALGIRLTNMATELEQVGVLLEKDGRYWQIDAMPK